MNLNHKTGSEEGTTLLGVGLPFHTAIGLTANERNEIYATTI